MANRIMSPRREILVTTNGNQLMVNEEQRLRIENMQMVNNFYSMRELYLRKLLDKKGRDLDDECGYPHYLLPMHYKQMYDREPIAARVVGYYPDEAWAVDPEVEETSDSEQDTEFESALEELNEKFGLWSKLHRADLMSGIGRFGVMLYGFDDGGALDTPVPGIDPRTGEQKQSNRKCDLLFLRCFEETEVLISEFEQDSTSPRYGQPKFYQILLITTPTIQQTDQIFTNMKVHWTRIQHFCKNRRTSEVFGDPEQQNVFNRLLDIRKLLGGSAEMFWKNAAPGYSLEVPPELVAVARIDKESLRKEMEAYFNGLQRYMALQGMNAKSLAPQVADPKSHFDTQLKSIAIAKGVPHRIFAGAEEAQLASSQDVRTANKRVRRYETKYLSPYVIRPTIERLCYVGVLPLPKKGFRTNWPDLNVPTDADKSNVALVETQAIAQFFGSGTYLIMAPVDFFTEVLKWDRERAERVAKSAQAFQTQGKKLMAIHNPAPVGGANSKGAGNSQGKNNPKPKGGTSASSRNDGGKPNSRPPSKGAQ